MAGQEFDKSFNKFYFLPCFEQFVEEHFGSSFSVWREELHSSPVSSRFAFPATHHSAPVPARSAAPKFGVLSTRVNTQPSEVT